MDAATRRVWISFQRWRPPCAFTARSQSSPIKTSLDDCGAKINRGGGGYALTSPTPMRSPQCCLEEAKAACSLTERAGSAASKSVKRQATFGYIEHSQRTL